MRDTKANDIDVELSNLRQIHSKSAVQPKYCDKRNFSTSRRLWSWMPLNERVIEFDGDDDGVERGALVGDKTAGFKCHIMFKITSPLHAQQQQQRTRAKLDARYKVWRKNVRNKYENLYGRWTVFEYYYYCCYYYFNLLTLLS